MRALSRVRWTPLLLAGLAAIWMYPILWTLTNAFRTTADIYRGPLDLPSPPAFGNLAEAWSRADLGSALLNSAYVATLTVAGVLVLAVPAAFALTRLRPPLRGPLFLVILAPLIIPTEVLVVPLFSIFRTFGLINSLPGLALVNVVSSVSFATLLLAAHFRRIPQELIDASRVDGADRLGILLRIVVPLARPGLVAVALLVAVFAWNDFAGALVLLQRPDTFTAPLALTTFSTFYETDEGLKFAGLAIVFLPPLVLFLLLQRTFMDGLTTGAIRG
jgi:raffinose/stachyose/melibiose transport system permease protein